LQDTKTQASPIDWLGEKLFHITQTPQVWIDHQIFEENGELIFSWDAVDELFPDSMIQDMFDAYCHLLHQLIADDDVWHQTHIYSLPTYQQTLRNKVNETRVLIPEKLLHDGFFQQAVKQPDHLAIIGLDFSFSYAEIADKSLQIAHFIKQNTVAKKLESTIIAVVMQKGWQQSVACLAILKSGGVYIPIDPELPSERINYLLEHTDTQLVLTQSVLSNQLAYIDYCQIVAVDSDVFDGQSTEPLANSRHPEDLAYIIFTSGSTGLPKGVMIDHRGAMNTIVDINRKFNLVPQDRVIAISNLNFDLSVYDLFGTFDAGATLVIPDAAQERDPVHWLQCIDQYQVSVWNSVPALIKMLVDSLLDKAQELQSLRLVMLSGDWIPLGLPEQIKTLNQQVEVISLGGATEASIWSVYYPIDHVDESWNSIPYGKALDNQQLWVLNSRYENTPTWVSGEIFIAGIGLAQGYWKDNDKTEASFINNPLTNERYYRTGDLGRFLPDGNIEFLGREDFQVKIQGYRIELGEIESALLQFEAIETAVVIAKEGLHHNRYLVAYIVGEFDESELRNFLSGKLASYMMPKQLINIAELPLTANGKIDRNALPDLSNTEDDDVPYEAAKTKTEAWLISTLSNYFKDNDRISRHDSFFSLGGDSLVATRFVNNIRQQFQIAMPLAEFFNQSHCLSHLGEFIDIQPTVILQTQALPQIQPDREHRFQPFALNEIQQAYWLGRQGGFTLGNIPCHYYGEFKVKDMDIQRLTDAWNIIINRHDMLRMTISNNGQQQCLDSVADYVITTKDVSQNNEVEIQASIRQFRDELEAQMFDTTQWPLFELRAHDLGENNYLLHFSFDLLIADVWSFLIILDEWHQCYQNIETQLPTLDLTFRDYVLAEQALQQTNAEKTAWEYWQNRIDTLPAGPVLPLAKQPSEIEKPKFIRLSHRLSVKQWSLLKQRGKQANLTPSMILCAVYADVLALWSKSQHFTLNLTLFNRLPLHPKTQQIVGDFTTLILLERQASSGLSFEQRAKQLQQQLVTDMEHRQINGIRVLRDIAKNTDNAGTPIVFTSALPLTDNEDSDDYPTDWLGEQVYSITQTPQVWLDHQVNEHHGELMLSWDLVEALFPDNVINDMFNTYCNALVALSESDSAWQQIDLVSLPAEQKQCREKINATNHGVPKGLLTDPFLQQVKQNPDAIAIIAPEKQLSYGELEVLSRIVAKQIQQTGCKGEFVGILMKKGWEQSVACLGILRAGYAYFPINPDLPKKRLEFLLSHTDTILVLTHEATQSILADFSGIKTLKVDSYIADDSAELRPVLTQANDLAYVIFTSGSTGLPKGVMIEHEGA
ncbi:MAG: amino acid adenylation domain-containing protein, partial [Methylococcales bacterium]|nr:amino acid adenylation domain-containing protein [Methylococcales bacterium]